MACCHSLGCGELVGKGYSTACCEGIEVNLSGGGSTKEFDDAPRRNDDDDEEEEDEEEEEEEAEEVASDPALAGP